MPDDPPIPREKLSKTPSWIMVGFVLGALFSYSVQRHVEKTKSPPPTPPVATPPPEPPRSPAVLKDHASLTAIENVFAEYERHAVWHNDLTEVALWTPETNKYSEFFEVLRSGDVYYFRTIPKLTRPVIRPNLVPNAPLRFTEPEDVQLKRLRETSSIWLPPSTEP